jgi:hypothetical protein
VQDGIVLAQDKYASDLLKRTGIVISKPVGTPLATEEKLASYIGTPLDREDSSQYRSIVGALLYLTPRQLDIAFVVNKVYQFLDAPTGVHWEVVKRILWYLKGCTRLALTIVKNNSLLVSAFSDAEWAGCLDDRRSIGGYDIFLGTNLVSWSVGKQPMIFRSSTEVEYKAAANVVAKVAWVQTLLKEMGIPSPKQARLLCDNLGAKYLTSNPVFHGRVKHIKIDYHFVRERVARGLL